MRDQEHMNKAQNQNGKNLPQQTDLLFQKSFDNFDVPPNPAVWKAVKKEIPLNLWLRNQLNWLSRIAAALLLFMISLVLLDRLAPSPNAEVATLPYEELSAAQQNISSTELPAKADFVMDIPQESDLPSTNAWLPKKRPKATEELESLWSLILEEDEELAAAIDEDRIEEALKPLDFLPIEGLALFPPNTEAPTKPTEALEDIEIKIMIPLKVVEENEVNDLLHLYDQQQAQKKDME